MTERPGQWAYFSVEGPYGFPLVCHALDGKQPDGAIPITPQQAAEIDEATTARSRKPEQRIAAAGINLQPLQDQIDALAQAVVGHAQTLDQHEAAVTAVSQSVSNFMQGQSDLAKGGEG